MTDHVCGLRGFDGMRGDVCPGCEATTPPARAGEAQTCATCGWPASDVMHDNPIAHGYHPFVVSPAVPPILQAQHGHIHVPVGEPWQPSITEKVLSSTIKKADTTKFIDCYAEGTRLEVPFPTDEDIEAIENDVGMGYGAWDMVNPRDLVYAAWKRLAKVQRDPRC